jgi:hypothetical protein
VKPAQLQSLPFPQKPAKLWKANPLVNAAFMPPSLPASPFQFVETYAADAVTCHLFQISNKKGTINEVPSPGGVMALP